MTEAQWFYAQLALIPVAVLLCWILSKLENEDE